MITGGTAVGENSKGKAWFGVRDAVQAKMDVLLAANDKERRHDLKAQIAGYDGRILLICALQEASIHWPLVRVRRSHDGYVTVT